MITIAKSSHAKTSDIYLHAEADDPAVRAALIRRRVDQWRYALNA